MARSRQFNFDEVNGCDRLQEMTQGRKPDRCIDTSGYEAHGTEQAPEMYETFRDQKGGCIEVVIQP